MNPQDNKRHVEEYIKSHKIDILFKEMLLTSISATKKKEESNEKPNPIIEMINYLSQFVKEEDLNTAGIKLNKPTQVLNKPFITSIQFPENSSLIAKKFLTQSVIDKLKMVKTKFGGSISHIIDVSLKLENKESVGLLATDNESFSKMSLLFKPAIEFLHQYDNIKSLLCISKYAKLENLVQSDLISRIKSKVSRNIKDYPYLPYCSEHTRKEIFDKVTLVLQKLYPNGYLYTIDHNDFESIREEVFDKEINLIAAGLVSNHYGIFSITNTNQSEKATKFYVLINFNDHLQIVGVSNEENKCFKTLIDINDKVNHEIESLIEFDKNDSQGYLTVCPSNIGEAMKLSVFMKIPKVIQDGNSSILFSKWLIRTKKQIGTEGVYELLSKTKIGVDRLSFINSFIVKINSILNFETSLQSKSDFLMKKMELNVKVSTSLKSAYDQYYDSYKLVSVENNSSLFYFNQILDCNSNILPYSYNSYHIYKDFFNDYITGETGVYMLREYEDPIKNKEKYKVENKVEKTLLSKLNEHNHIKILYNLGRNIKNKNFYIENTNSSYISNEDIDRIYYSLQDSLKPKGINKNQSLLDEKVEKEGDCLLINQFTKVFFNRNGNHIEIESFNFDDIIIVENEISKVVEYEYDNVFGFIHRDVFYCGVGLKIFISLPHDYNINEGVLEKNDFKVLYCDEKEKKIINSFSISLSLVDILNKVKSLFEEMSLA